MQFYHKCEKTVTGTLCSGIVVHYGQNTQVIELCSKIPARGNEPEGATGSCDFQSLDGST